MIWRGKKMDIKYAISLITDTKLYFEIKEKASGASFGIHNTTNTVNKNLLAIEVVSINSQYVDGKRLLIIEF
jgi:hypothetical protein